MVYFNQETVEVKRVAGYTLLVIAFVINIPLQAGIAIYGLVYAIRAFIDGNISTGIIAISIAAVCVVIAHFAVPCIDAFEGSSRIALEQDRCRDNPS